MTDEERMLALDRELTHVQDLYNRCLARESESRRRMRDADEKETRATGFVSGALEDLERLAEAVTDWTTPEEVRSAILGSVAYLRRQLELAGLVWS